MGGQSQGLISFGVKLAGPALAGRLVSFGKKQATAGEKCIGVAFTDGVAGDFIPVTAVGSATVMSGGVIAFGDTLMSDANGCAVKYDGSGLKVGTAYEAASAAGQMIEMLCDTSAAENDVRAVVGLTGGIGILASGVQVGGNGAPYVFTSRALADSDNGMTLKCASAQVATVNTGRAVGFGVAFKGPVTFDGNATVTDVRTTGAANPWCALMNTGVDTYDVVGSKA